MFGVGDDDQCIYGHAGADPAFLIDYERLFPGAVPHPLTVNYRCPVEVVAGARTLLGYNHRRVDKQIDAGPGQRPRRLARCASSSTAATTAPRLRSTVVRAWLDEPDVPAASIAVLARVNSLLLAPHVALHEAGVPISSVLRPDVLERTGMRAALAYLRLATSADAMAADDIVEILRRPTRGLPQWFPERLGPAVALVARPARRARRPGAGQGGRQGAAPRRRPRRRARRRAHRHDARSVLEAVRDEIGLGTAMSLLDRTGGGQGSSHLDDLEGLLGVADLHPDPTGFEPWLRTAFSRESTPGGVTLSTIHRVKGREWDRVAVFGVADGIVPHRLAEDVEEERRVLHVAITRVPSPGRPCSPTAPARARSSPSLPGRHRTGRRHGRSPRSGKPATAPPRPAGGIAAAEGLVLTVPGGFSATVEDADGRAALVRLSSGSTLRVRYGERVEHNGRRAPLAAPTSCGVRRPTPSRRCGRGAPSGRGPTACRRTSSPATSTSAASPSPAPRLRSS